jgi:hypothetical protein
VDNVLGEGYVLISLLIMRKIEGFQHKETMTDSQVS